jgi:hypothetical protein
MFITIYLAMDYTVAAQKAHFPDSSPLFTLNNTENNDHYSIQEW